MTIPHVIDWVDGAPGKIEPGMFLLYEDGSYCLTGTDDAEKTCCIAVKHATIIKPHELEWAASMGVKRELGK